MILFSFETYCKSMWLLLTKTTALYFYTTLRVVTHFAPTLFISHYYLPQ